MDFHDDHAGRTELGRNPLTGATYLVADVEPLDVDGVRTVAVGSALWVLGFVALLPFSGQLTDTGRGWWLFACLAGAGLGLVGLEYCRRRRTSRLGDPEEGPEGHDGAGEPAA